MNTSTRRMNPDRLRLSLRWLWAGPVAGIVCMAALFAYGLATGTGPLLAMSSSIAGALAAGWTAAHVALRARLANAEQA